MNILIDNISFIKFNSRYNLKNIKNASENIASKKDFLPEVSIIDTGINDFRLESLIVEKRERMIQQHLLPPEYLYVDQYGINRVKPHLFIKKIIVKPEFLRQGVCREAEQKIVQLSKDEGMEGRVILFSSPIKGKNSYIQNPTLAHWANGFRFYGSDYVRQMLEVLNGERTAQNAPVGCMYYLII